MTSLIRSLLMSALLAVAASGAMAQAHGDKEIQQDIQRHRAIAGAHEAAAKCLETRRKPEQCMQDLQTACKGLAIGKYCGMKHGH
jgi:hypothetical protein